MHTSSALSFSLSGAASSGGDSGSSDSSSDDGSSDSDSDDENADWPRYREVDAKDDDDSDDTHPHIDPKRRALTSVALDAPGTGPSGGQPPDSAVQHVGNKAQYNKDLDDFVHRVDALREQMQTKEFKKLTAKEKRVFVNEKGDQPEFTPPGLTKPLYIPPGLPQLEQLMSDGRWHITVVDVKMTSTQTPQGKKHKYSAMVMVGDLNGTGGYGIGAAKEVNDAVFKAVRFAILNSITIPRYRKHTLYYPSQSKFIKTKISIFPRPLDFGLVASPFIVEACELLGILDLTVKTHGSRNVRNVLKGFFSAIASIPTPSEVAEARGTYVREKVGRQLRAPRL